MFQRPTLPDLIARGLADIESRLPGADTKLLRRTLRVLGLVNAGAAHHLHGHLDYLSKQILPSTAESDYLARRAAEWGVARLAAGAAAGNAIFSGTNGNLIPAGTVLLRADGWRYTVDALATIASGTATAAVTAVDPGKDGNAGAGATLTLAAPIAGVQSTATVAAGGLSQGADVEADEALRARLLARIRQPPEGGSAHDYIHWAKSVPGVTRVWVTRELGPGTAAVRFVRDDDPVIFPDAAAIAAVEAVILAKKPVPADVYVLAPVPVALDFTLRLTPATAAVKFAVETELADLIDREAAPGQTLYRSHISEAISLAAGEVDHALLSPAADVELLPGQMLTLGTITWA
jgi:uncharacterized phage protein gp47/JayE